MPTRERTITLTRYLHRTVAIALTVAAGISAGGCADNGEESITTPVAVQSVLEYQSQSADGTRFLLYGQESAEPQILTSTSTVNLGSDIKEGDSFLVYYRPLAGKTDVSGPIEVIGLSRINNLDLKKGTEKDLEGWSNDPVWVTSVWRAGAKVNMRLRLPYDTKPRTFAVVVDESTIGEAYPSAYLVHARANLSENTFYRQYYASVNCSQLWETEGVEGMKLYISNSNDETKNLFIIEKP